MAKLVSKVYGDALMQAAREKGKLDEVYEESLELYGIFQEQQDLIHLLDHPQVVKEEKIQIICNVFQGKVSDEMMGIGTALVTSAVEMTDAQKEQVKSKLLATTRYVEFDMDYSVDPSLIGGMVIRIGDRVVDSSIKTRLYELKKQLLNVQLA